MPGTVDVLLTPPRAEGRALEVALESLRTELDTASSPIIGSDLRLLVKQCCRYPEEMRELLSALQARAPRFGAPRHFRATFEGMLDLLDGRLRVARSLMDLVRNAGPAEDKSDHLARLAAAQAELDTLRTHIARLWAWMNAPAPRFDQVLAAEAQAAFEQGEHDDVQILYDQVRAGEGLEGN